MKDINDNKTVDWVSAERSQLIGFEQVLSILAAIHAKPLTTSRDISNELNLGIRASQRYLKQLESAGYIKVMSCKYYDFKRYQLTQKSAKFVGDNA